MLLNLPVETENVRALLTTLATAEASVLAIVFSVTVVALQLVVTRYSARLTSLFVKEPLFRTTFALFVGAIAFNLLVVYLLPVQNARLTNAAVGVAFALAAVSTLALYRFIRLMIQRSSPDELIAVMVERELAPDEYLPATVAEFQAIEVHPIRPLYRTIARALELGEYQTAEQGINGLRTVLIRSFEYLEDKYAEPASEPDSTSAEDAAQYATVVSTEILTEYVSPILEQAYTHEQYDLISDAIGDVEAIALDGLGRGFTNVTEDAAEGLGDAFDAAPLTWEGNRLRSPVKESLLELTKATAADVEYTTFLLVSHHLDHQLTVLLRRRPDANVTHRLVGDYYSRETAEIFEVLVDRYADDVQDQDINWISPTEGRKWTLPDEAEPLRHFWREYASFTETVLQYRVSEEEYPFDGGSIDDGWKRITENAADAGIDGLATLCCITTLQLAYHVDKLENGRLGMWTNNLGRLRLDYDPAIVDRAFELLKTDERPEGQNISVRTIDPTSADTDKGFFSQFLNSDQEDVPFEEWLVDFERKVHERTEYLQERQ
ncbi:hypothetical protein C453_01090 [Haloferax elongans ATCC BAA-1513]|uniref:DUF2254 domain-containing protein n=1 Tax=Haloferax elongans ATCC BAA-1513 TaxID=1230453 RepID=M0HW26_HALEO|nr:hypothetical protein C453_01090 [Haloferax elongans ATCC BAA-1513]